MVKKNKVKYIDTSVFSIGMGNEYADFFFLRKCSRPVAVYPDGRLRAVAKQQHWEIYE